MARRCGFWTSSRRSRRRPGARRSSELHADAAGRRAGDLGRCHADPAISSAPCRRTDIAEGDAPLRGVVSRLLRVVTGAWARVTAHLPDSARAAPEFPGAFAYQASGTGAQITSSIRGAPVASITSRSKPSAMPAAGGHQRQRRQKILVQRIALAIDPLPSRPSPASKRRRCSAGSVNSPKPFASSTPQA